MARPIRCRRICMEPDFDSFSPDLRQPTEDVVLTLDEYEAIRLIDFEKQTHAECARQMDISRTTVTEIYESARYKIADSIVNGKRLRIAGGHYAFCNGRNNGCQRHCWQGASVFLKRTPSAQNKKGTDNMKVAVTYDNGMIFQHFGHTPQFKVYTVENGAVTGEEVLDTNGSGHGALAGFLQNAGVNTLICGCIGAGAQQALQNAGIELYGGASGSADDAVKALLAGTLAYNPNVHCSHHDHAHGGESHVCGAHGCGNH